MKPSDSKERVRERVRKHRELQRDLRPKTPPTPDADPWELARKTIKLMRAARKGLSDPELVVKLDEAIEGVKELSWGPEK